jgi:hypothetical protein
MTLRRLHILPVRVGVVLSIAALCVVVGYVVPHA